MTDSYQEGQMISEDGEEMEVDQGQAGILEQQRDGRVAGGNWVDQRFCARFPHHESPDQEL